jgi:hypothetical protein
VGRAAAGIASEHKRSDPVTLPLLVKLQIQRNPALQQSEQLYRAASSVGPFARPVPLFYAMSQAGRESCFEHRLLTGNRLRARDWSAIVVEVHPAELLQADFHRCDVDEEHSGEAVHLRPAAPWVLGQGR